MSSCDDDFSGGQDGSPGRGDVTEGAESGEPAACPTAIIGGRHPPPEQATHQGPGSRPATRPHRPGVCAQGHPHHPRSRSALPQRPGPTRLVRHA
jgi:hypothetical protein